jgi:thiosulfate dehydrogenase
VRTTASLLIGLTMLSVSGACAAAASPPAAPTQYPPGPLGAMVRLGEDIMMHTGTNPLTKDLVGNKLNCTDCHLDGGKTDVLGTFLGTSTAFPAWSVREKSVQTLQDRIDNCFMRSMNGKRPIIDSKASVAMAAYVTWLSEGLPVKLNPVKPVTPLFSATWPDRSLVPLVKAASHASYEHGRELYAAKCAGCHGAQGEGVGSFPPLWGNGSYNAGAGMTNLVQMSSWIMPNMPPSGPKLTRQEAVDISVYVDAQPRPDFDLKQHLLPASQMGYYNSNVPEEQDSVRSRFRALGLDVDAVRGDKVIH